MKETLHRLQMNMAVLFPGIANAATARTDILSSKDKIISLLCVTVDWMFWGLITLSIAMFIIGGYTYATASGDPEKVSKANKTLLYAAIAVVVALVAAGVPTLIGSFFGIGANDLKAC